MHCGAWIVQEVEQKETKGRFMEYAILFGVMLAIGRLFISPKKPTGADVYKDMAHLFMGGLLVALWRDGEPWQHWLFWSLCVWEVSVAIISRKIMKKKTGGIGAMKKAGVFIGMILSAALLSGCAGGFGLVRIMEPPMKDIDTAELAANLPKGKALHIDYNFESMQPKSSLSAGNDASLNLASITDLISYGAALQGADGTAKAFADIANKDRRIGVQITIADSDDIRAMRVSDNNTRLVQQGKIVDVVNRVVVTQTVPVTIDPIDPVDPPVVVTNTVPPVKPVDPAPVEPDPNADLDAISIAGATLLGPHKNVDPAKAKITDVLTSVIVAFNGITMEYETQAWPNNDSPAGDNIDGRVYIYWRDGDGLVGGHFDWKRPDTKDRTFTNIRNGYLSGRKPPVGAELWFVLVTNKGDRRTNVIKGDGVWE